MNRSILQLEARRSASLTIWLAVTAFLYGGIIAGFYPTMRDNAKVLENYMKILPAGLLAAFGMDLGGLGDPGVFFSTYMGTWLWPILAAAAGILLATRPVAADLERGFIELPLSTRVPRWRYLTLTIVAHAGAIVVAASAAVAGFLVFGFAVGAGFDGPRFLLVVIPAAALGWAIHGVASALAVATLSRGMAGGITAGILIGMYLLDVVGRLQPDLDWVSTFSLLHHFDVARVIDEGVLDLGGLGLFLAVAVLGWAIAVRGFQGRDLVA